MNDQRFYKKNKRFQFFCTYSHNYIIITKLKMYNFVFQAVSHYCMLSVFKRRTSNRIVDNIIKMS